MISRFQEEEDGRDGGHAGRCGRGPESPLQCRDILFQRRTCRVSASCVIVALVSPELFEAKRRSQVDRCDDGIILGVFGGAREHGFSSDIHQSLPLDL